MLLDIFASLGLSSLIWKILNHMTVAYLHSKILEGPPVQILSISCSFGKFWQNHMLAPPGGLAPSPWGNPGCATASLLSLQLNWVWETSNKYRPKKKLRKGNVFTGVCSQGSPHVTITDDALDQPNIPDMGPTVFKLVHLRTYFPPTSTDV